jgi:hypothetical protein
MATRFNVEYADGNVVEYKVRPRDILKIERESGGLSASIESSYKLAFYASGSEKKFEDWIEDIEDIQPVEDESAADSAPSS